MTTVKEFLQFLETLPEDTEVCVAESYYGYEPGTKWVNLDLDQYSGNVDYFTYNGKTSLYLGNA
jgi:hypothetical protein